MTQNKTTDCCVAFRGAQQRGTDGEGYGSLISCSFGLWQMGFDLPPLVYCPWCGKELDNQHDQ